MSKKTLGHRKWGARSGKVPGKHVGDLMSPETRSQLMSRIQGSDTGPERIMVEALRVCGESRIERNAPDLAGKPDIVFREERLAVFVDGDFWHGFRFPLWEHKLSPKWQAKIAATRARDKRNFRRLRYAGWTVLRIWEHQIERDVAKCATKVLKLLEKTRGTAKPS